MFVLFLLPACNYDREPLSKYPLWHVCKQEEPNNYCVVFFHFKLLIFDLEKGKRKEKKIRNLRSDRDINRREDENNKKTGDGCTHVITCLFVDGGGIDTGRCINDVPHENKRG